MVYKFLKCFFVLFGLLFAFPYYVYASTQWDGRYTVALDFKMSPKTVCPRTLTIEIEISVEKGIISGFIFNNGGGNKHKFCKLYHNGEINGKVGSDGTFRDTYIRQNDPHSSKYSSYLITGKINGTLLLKSKSSLPVKMPMSCFIIE